MRKGQKINERLKMPLGEKREWGEETDQVRNKKNVKGMKREKR